MKRTVLTLFTLLVFAFLGATTPASGQDLIHYWNFNNPGTNANPWPQPVDADVGTGEISYTFAGVDIEDYNGTTVNTQGSDGAGKSFSVLDQVSNGEFLHLKIPSTGYENIEVTYATQGTGSGFDSQEVSYSVDDGDTYTTLDTFAPPSSYETRTVNLSGIPATDDEGGLVVRIILDGATASNGNNRFDNISVFGTPLSGGPVTNKTQSTTYPTIQAAIDDANDSDEIEVSNGTYNESLSIQVDNLTVGGESETGVIVNTDPNGYGVSIAADGVTLEKMTINGPTADANNSYGIKAQGESTLPSDSGSPEDRADGLTLRNLTVQGSGRSEIDLNGVDNAVLENLTAEGDGTSGVGLALTDCNNATISGLTTNGNNWGGAAVFVKGEFYTVGSDGVAFTGSNTFNETAPTPAAYTQASGSATLADIQNLTPPSEVAYAVTEPGAELSAVFGFKDQSGALTAAASGSGNPYALELSSGDFYVSDGLSIQAAIDGAKNIQAAVGSGTSSGLLSVPFGKTVNVLQGTYDETVTVDIETTLQGVAGGGS